MTTIEIILAVIALAFVVLVVFLVRILIKAYETFRRVNCTLALAQKQLLDLQEEPKKLFSTINDIASDVNCKLENLDPLFGALSNLGIAAESRTAALNEFPTPSRSFKAHAQVDLGSPSEDIASDLIDLALTGFSVWQKIKTRRK